MNNEEKILSLLESMHGDIADLKNEQTKTNDRLGKIEDRLGNVDDRLGDVNSRLNQIDGRLNLLDSKQRETKETLDTVFEQAASLTEYDTRVARKLATVQAEIAKIMTGQ